MPVTPSPSRQKRAIAQSDCTLPVSNQEEVVEPLEPPTGERSAQSRLPVDETTLKRRMWVKAATDLFRFVDNTEILLEKAVAWIADEIGSPVALYQVTSKDPVSLSIRAFHPKERWMERITQDLLSIPARLQPGTMEQLLSGEKPLRVSDVDAEGLPENAVDAGIESILLVPMRSESYDAGMLLCMSRQGSPMHEEDNALAVALSEMVATAVDVQSTLLDLRRAIKLRDMSISTASHELRNGLATTKSLAQMSLRAIKTDSVGGKAKAETHLEMILRQIDWLTDLTGVVFDVSRIDNGQIELKREPTSLNSVVVGVIERFRGIMAEHTKLRLNVVLPNVQLMGSWDRERVDQVLTNLLANAIKYSPKGGLLTVRVEQKDPREPNHEKLEERRSGLDAVRLAVVAISDQGIGIPSNQQASIFEPYYRATNVPKELAGGLGLGLHICKGIVEAHGGDLWVESEEGRGSTFYFSLPLES